VLEVKGPPENLFSKKKTKRTMSTVFFRALETFRNRVWEKRRNTCDPEFKVGKGFPGLCRYQAMREHLRPRKKLGHSHQGKANRTCPE